MAEDSVSTAVARETRRDDGAGAHEGGGEPEQLAQHGDEVQQAEAFWKEEVSDNISKNKAFVLSEINKRSEGCAVSHLGLFG